MKQKDIFLASEGNAYSKRNASASGTGKLPDSDSLLIEIIGLPLAPAEKTKVLEIGCGDGARLNWLRENRGYACYGVDPSSHAVEVARRGGIDARQGAADTLPFDDNTFEV